MINKLVIPGLKVFLYIYVIFLSVCVIWHNELRCQQLKFKMGCLETKIVESSDEVDKHKVTIDKLEFNINDLRLRINEMSK